MAAVVKTGALASNAESILVKVTDVKDGTPGLTADILKSDIVGAAPNTIAGLVYVGAKLEGSATACADIDGAAGNTEEIDKSDIVGTAPNTKVGFVYPGAKLEGSETA